MPQYAYNGNPPYTPTLVYCDMVTVENGYAGGWTLMSSAETEMNLMAGKTLAQYRSTFGNPNTQDVWLGLDLINGMTNEMETRYHVSYRHICEKKSALLVIIRKKICVNF